MSSHQSVRQGLQAGTILGRRYLLAEPLGHGGMGAVYAATDLRTGGRVAVKLLHPALTSEADDVARLRREAQIAAALTSPRVVRVIDLDVDPRTGITFLVQEYVAGQTLAEVLAARGPLPLTEALAIGVEVAKALEAAHAAGVVHRDLKPHNIMLVDGQVKVLDFGIARMTGDPALTAAGVYLGTPAYSAPEQSDGQGDIRADIYALGVILYELLTGRPPFHGPTPLAVIRLHATTPPPPLPATVPGPVRDLVARCLAKEPAVRYQTPTELIAALDAVMDARAALAPGPEATGTARVPASGGLSERTGAAGPAPRHQLPAARAALAPRVLAILAPCFGVLVCGILVVGFTGIPFRHSPRGPASTNRSSPPGRVEPTADAPLELIAVDYQPGKLLYDMIVRNNTNTVHVVSRLGITSQTTGTLNPHCPTSGGFPLPSQGQYDLRFDPRKAETVQKMEPPLAIPPGDVVRFTVSLAPDSTIGCSDDWRASITLYIEISNGIRLSAAPVTITVADLVRR